MGTLAMQAISVYKESATKSKMNSKVEQSFFRS